MALGSAPAAARMVRHEQGLPCITTETNMTDREARKQGVGGEVLCYIW